MHTINWPEVSANYLFGYIRDSSRRLYNFSRENVHPSIIANEIWLLEEATTEWKRRYHPDSPDAHTSHTPTREGAAPPRSPTHKRVA